MAKGKIAFKFNIKKRILPVILVSVLMPLILFVAIPFEVFANNMDEFLFSLSSFLPLSILFGFLLAVGTALLLIFLPERLYRVAYALVLALSFLLFMQGTFLNFGATYLAGDNPGSNTVHIGLKILDVIIWIAVPAVAIALALVKDKKGIIAIIAVILSIVVASTQIVTPVASIVKHPDVFLSKEERLAKDGNDFKNEIVTCENLTAVSTDRNIFYFCIDRFDEIFAETAYGKNPEIFSELDGFTWFKDAVSLYGHTYPSVAYMLTEKPLDTKKQLRKEYLDTVYLENNTLSVLDQNGYSVNLYTAPYYAYNSASALPDYVDNISVSKKLVTSYPAKLVKYMVANAGYRCMPIFFKDLIVGFESSKFNSYITNIGENDYPNYDTDNTVALERVKEAAFKEKNNKNFTFFHIEGCHSVSVGLSAKKEVTDTVEYCFQIVNEYIKILKEKNLYQNATIIITGDHGSPINNLTALNDTRRTALFFKRSGDAGADLVFSDAPVAHENIWPSIMQSENIRRENNGVTLFEVPANNERKYIWHTYRSDKCDEYIYKIVGSGKNFDNWELIEHNYLDRFIMS